LLGPVRHRCAKAQIHLTAIRARATLVSARTALVNAARGLTKSFGERLAKCGTEQMNREIAKGLSPELRDVSLCIVFYDCRQASCYFGNVTQQRFFFLGERGTFQILEGAPHQVFAPKKFGGNRDMRLGAEITLVDVRSVSRDQFPKARRQGRWFVHDAMSEACEMGSYLGAKREEMPDLPVFLSGIPGGLDQIKVRLGCGLS
jgi:hypothetical protein